MHRHISESHHRKFYRERLRYAIDVDYWNSVQKENVLNDMTPLAPWGDFNDQDGWAGYVPCKDYLVVVFLKLAESNMGFMRRSMQMLDAQILVGDASLKGPKVHSVEWWSASEEVSVHSYEWVRPSCWLVVCGSRQHGAFAALL